MTPIDFHIHAAAYRAVQPRPDHTAGAIQRRCADLGFASIGIVEHINHSPKHPVECLQALVAECRRNHPPLPCRVGAEADILDGGGLTCTADQKRSLGLDYLLGAVHADIGQYSDVHAYVEDEFRRPRRLQGRFEKSAFFDNSSMGKPSKIGYLTGN